MEKTEDGIMDFTKMKNWKGWLTMPCSLYNYIVYLRRQSLLDSKEFSYFLYEIDKIVSNEDIKHYFLFLQQYTKQNGLPFKYEHLIHYGIEKGLLKPESFDLK